VGLGCRRSNQCGICGTAFGAAGAILVGLLTAALGLAGGRAVGCLAVSSLGALFLESCMHSLWVGGRIAQIDMIPQV
jgi:hypothetical protein